MCIRDRDIPACHCGAVADRAFRNGRHWMTCCCKAFRWLVHNRLRDVVSDIYRSGLKMVAEKEVGGLYAQPSLDGCDKRPADVLAHTSEGAMAIDVTITDPTCKTALEKNSHIIPLIAAKTRHDVKVANHRKQVEKTCLLYTSPSPRDRQKTRMPSSA